MLATNFIHEYLKNVGQTPQNELNVDGSGVAVRFSYTPTQKMLASRLIIYISDNQNFGEDKFGSVSLLDNGVDVGIGETILVNWKDNIDVLTSAFEFGDTGGPLAKSSKSVSANWQFYRSNREDRGIFIPANTAFFIDVNDDLSGLTHFRALIQGEKY